MPFPHCFLFRPPSINTADTSSRRVHCVFGLLRNPQQRIKFWINMLLALSQRKLDMFVWLVILMFVFVEDNDLYGLVTKRGFLISGGKPAGFPPACWTVSEDPLYLMGRSCAYVCACVFDWFPVTETVWVCPFCSVFCGANTAVAGPCVEDCTQYVHMASVLGEVQECEIRRWFVKGDNEQSAILTGWAMGCKLRSCYTPSDFSHFKLFFK